MLTAPASAAAELPEATAADSTAATLRPPPADVPSEPSGPTVEADGWDCDLPDMGVLEEEEEEQEAPPEEPLLPLLERVREAAYAAEHSPRPGPAVKPRAAALRAALIAYLDDEAEPGAQPRASATSVARYDKELQDEDDGSLFDLKPASLVAEPAPTLLAMSPPSTVPRMARRTVTTPDRCEAPRSALARSWTAGVRSSFEAVASTALDFDTLTTVP